MQCYGEIGVTPYSLLIRARLTELKQMLLVATGLFRIPLVADWIEANETSTSSGYGTVPDTTSSH